MKRLGVLLIGLLVLGISCRKSGGAVVYPEPQIPRVKATISINGGSVATINSSGSSTFFKRSTGSNGDIITSIYGSDGDKQVGLIIVNITATGTYTLSNSTTGQRVSCTYSVGNPTAGPYQIFFTSTSPPPTGSITITEFTSTFIKGVYNANIKNGSDIAEITNGSFEGSYY